MVDLNDFFIDDFVKDVNNENIVKVSKVGDKVYMYLISLVLFYMVMNKKMLEDVGVVNFVKEGWIIDDFEKVLKVFKDKGYILGLLFSFG